jgi:hypothetical protein
MNRALIAPVVVAAALFAGCQQDEPKKPMTSAEPVKAAASPDAAKTAAAPKPPSAKEYYEVSKSGKTYVFGQLDSVLAFRKTGALPAATAEKPAFGPGGETVVFETANGVEPGLVAEYQKAHPKK